MPFNNLIKSVGTVIRSDFMRFCVMKLLKGGDSSLNHAPEKDFGSSEEREISNRNINITFSRTFN